ncbi:RNA-directed DNA polymerase [Aquabacterium sp.]|uniref:RNA-directed DNA polymerase n=1 Tax=Aquabacterium sp. TaxID=1872578 RepID=UPI002E345A2D|nr:RNA-directed DNA polymerase [Aquabacterium sp.]HEX5311981.1 RNA-directed DNA polymerase [Aquabacterium sp.]
MSILDTKYQRLGPSLALLTDEAVLAQAWKKTDSDVRRHNWYADILELEQASLLLPQKLEAWAAELNSGAALPETTPARVVLAPKNAKWHFPDKKDGGWRFKPQLDAAGNEVAQPELRPLAHLTIRDQVLATAVMLCVADAVESLQGNTDPSRFANASAARKHVFSYGNRLFCDWSTGPDGKQQARFRWGNATTYSQFFKDYERFLERPASVCREALPSLQGHRLYVVKLDLAKFYDCVDQARVLDRLKGIWATYAEQFGADQAATSEADENAFWSAAERVLRWSWNADDCKKAGALTMGLPQGLIASGFLANAYMHGFDCRVAAELGKEIDVSISGTLPVKLKLLDYCRYVDDMRLVVALPIQDAANLAMEHLASGVSDWINRALEAYEGNSCRLITKREKSEAVAWEDFAVQGSTSQFMRSVQGQISNAPDPSTLLQATGSLDHLLWLADALNDDAQVDGNSLALSRIALPKVDVRDDTIRRFAANRLRQVLRTRRSMADPELPGADAMSSAEVSELQALDHEMEAVARKLVACWSRNPALVSVLRCGMDIFPSVELLRPVTEALASKLTKLKKPGKETLVALYVLADLFKAAAVETGHHRPESYPEDSDILAYRAELVQLALSLSSKQELPWYLQQQIALFLAVMQFPIDLASKRGELAQYAKLHAALRYQVPNKADPDSLTAGLLVLRMTGDRAKFVIWLGHWLDKLSKPEAVKMIDQVAMIEPTLLPDVLRANGTTSKKAWPQRVRVYVPWTAPLDYSERLGDWRPGNRSLAYVAAHPENPFVQENALLKLAVGLLHDADKTLAVDSVCIHRVNIECDNWASIQNPDVGIKVSFNDDVAYSPPWTETPPWVQDDMRWAYRLGRVLRAAIIGESDYTSRHYPLREHTFDRYRGLQSSWYKRRMGLMPLTDGLGPEPTPVSPWLNELIMRLLQWPGLELQRDEVIGFGAVKRPSDLLRLIAQRQQVQRGFYGKLSQLPAYLLPVNSSASMDLRRFKVALVQTLMPKDADFSSTDPLLWMPDYRARHRAHLASMCRLLTQQLAAGRFAAKKPEIEQARRLDLIVFPELAIHPDDMWLLKRLSDSTGAVIFAGQTFVQHPYLKKPINRAVWLLRQTTNAGRSIATVYQGKQNGIPWELSNGVIGHRPFQVVVQFSDKQGATANLTGAICYDATDLKLSADMRDISDGFVIAALNKDINTFDTMASALQFHMYQPVMLANTGQYGGSTAQAPFKEHHERHIAHVHGNNQAAVSLFELDLTTFKSIAPTRVPKEKKSAPAGFKGRN